MYKKILLGIDSSEDAKDAIDKVIQLQKENNSEVVVFHSVLHRLSELAPALSIGVNPDSTLTYQIHKDRLKEGRKLLEDVKSKFEKENLTIETRLIYDLGPQYYIEKKTEEEGFDLVVLGCKGEHSKLKRTVIGTVPEHVINNAPTDVLIVK